MLIACLLVCLIVCMLSSTIVCVRACLRACVHECDHPSIVHLCDRVLDFCLAIFRCLFDSSCSHGLTRPHCSRPFTLRGAVLSGVRPTPAFGRSVCLALGHCGTRLRSAASALSHPQRSLPLWTLPFWRLAALVVLALGHSYICRCACC